jgi:hypothetical protein
MSSRVRSPRERRSVRWHRLTLPQLAFAIAAPILAARSLTPPSQIGVAASWRGSCTELTQRVGLGYQSVATMPGFPRAVAGVVARTAAWGFSRCLAASAKGPRTLSHTCR